MLYEASWALLHASLSLFLYFSLREVSHLARLLVFSGQFLLYISLDSRALSCTLSWSINFLLYLPQTRQTCPSMSAKIFELKVRTVCTMDRIFLCGGYFQTFRFSSLSQHPQKSNASKCIAFLYYRFYNFSPSRIFPHEYL